MVIHLYTAGSVKKAIENALQKRGALLDIIKQDTAICSTTLILLYLVMEIKI
jgi:hypothetical protein